MISRIKKIDAFEKNIIIVFLGTSVLNVFNLLYQLLIAHRFSPVDFAAFNSLLALYILISTPLATINAAVVKYTAGFNATADKGKIKFLLSRLFKITLALAIVTLIIFYLASPFIKEKLKIDSLASVYILGLMLFLSWITPVFNGALEGLELFKWFMSASIIGGLLKIILAFLFVTMAFGIAGALGAFLASGLVVLMISVFPLMKIVSFKSSDEKVDFKNFFLYLLPVAITTFCFNALIGFDMVLVKYFLSGQASGMYSLAQMVGKILIFLPAAISIVMFPRVSGLEAKQKETVSTLKKSLLYTALLCGAAALVYNIFPVSFLKILTGKVYPEAILLGRLFSVSMFFFALLHILLGYFLSLKDTRFIKYLILFTFLQFFLISLFHANPFQVQVILCLNGAAAFFTHLGILRSNSPA